MIGLTKIGIKGLCFRYDVKLSGINALGANPIKKIVLKRLIEELEVVNLFFFHFIVILLRYFEPIKPFLD